MSDQDVTLACRLSCLMTQSQRVPRAAIIFASIGLALAACGGAPRVPAGAESSCRGPTPDPVTLHARVDELTTRFAPRDFEHPDNLDRAAAYLGRELKATGATVREQVYRVGGHLYRNVLAEIGPETAERIVVGAHYDTAGDQPGADDNASGVAGLLELARMLAADPPPIRVELAAYTLEEPPNFRTERMGSAVHAADLASRGVRIRLMLALEMIGAFSDAPGSQGYPPVLGLFYPSQGNFIAVVNRWGDGSEAREVAAGLRAGSTIPVETLSAPSFVTGVDFSDHLSYWAHGYCGLMVTDTAFYRNPRYHTPDDKPETLDYKRMAQVVKGVHCAVHAVARR